MRAEEERKNRKFKMKSRFDKNYTEQGYLMKYVKDEKTASLNYQNKVLQFKIELPEILPLIWRRIHIPSDYNFWDLHVAIQNAMGWQNYHAHHFEIKGKHKHEITRIGLPDFDQEDDNFIVDPGWEIPLFQFYNELGVASKYLYDYGDQWWHTVQLEGYMYKEPKVKYPICIDGARACPPEDCGGERGYYDLLKTLANPEDEEYEQMRTWIGENWNPEYFDKYSIKFENPKKNWENAFLKEDKKERRAQKRTKNKK